MQDYLNSLRLNELTMNRDLNINNLFLSEKSQIVNGVLDNNFLNSPMDQFEIRPFLGEFLGLNYTPVGLITNILIYIALVVTFI
jgi:hypothetical protein